MASPAQASTLIAFPRELREDQQNWPTVEFAVQQPRNKPIKGPCSVFLPIPPGVSFSDNMSYSAMDFGVIGSFVNDLMNDQRGMKSTATASERIASAKDTGKRALSSFMNGPGALTIAAGIVGKFVPVAGADKLADVVNYNNKQIFAPNTTTTFQGPAVRAFSFSFRLVSKSKDDTSEVRRIDQFFRRYTYPLAQANKILEYPPVWTIKFYNGADRNSYIPGIYSCFLTSMSSTYNAGTNLWHEDGSPIEVDFQLSFQETRALTRKDIDWLNTHEGEKENDAS